MLPVSHRIAKSPAAAHTLPPTGSLPMALVKTRSIGSSDPGTPYTFGVPI
jgi:hypothetical protein